MVREQGFGIIHDVLASEDTQSLAENLHHAALRRSRAGVRHALEYPPVAALARDSRLVSLATGILGGSAFPYRATIFDKLPEANWLVVWHQDIALPLQERREIPGWGPWSLKEGVIYAHAPANALDRVVALRVHLDDSTSKNGPLRVLPGTHMAGVLTDDDIQPLTSQISPVDCLVAEGGVVVMRPLIVHASSKSTSTAPRRVIHIEYAVSALLEDGLQLAVA